LGFALNANIAKQGEHMLQKQDIYEERKNHEFARIDTNFSDEVENQDRVARLFNGLLLKAREAS